MAENGTHVLDDILFQLGAHADCPECSSGEQVLDGPDHPQRERLFCGVGLSAARCVSLAASVDDELHSPLNGMHFRRLLEKRALQRAGAVFNGRGTDGMGNLHIIDLEPAFHLELYDSPIPGKLRELLAAEEHGEIHGLFGGMGPGEFADGKGP